MDLSQLRIIHYPDPRLRKRSRPIEKVDQSIADLAARMFELMNEVKGLGLAAAQVGLNLRMFVTNHTGEPADDRVYINPEFLDMQGLVEHEEGCLSVPEVYVNLRRAQWARISAMDVKGERFEMEGQDLIARAWQHEMDHLNGVLIIERMSPTSKISNRKLLKKLEEDYNSGRLRSGVR